MLGVSAACGAARSMPDLLAVTTSGKPMQGIGKRPAASGGFSQKGTQEYRTGSNSGKQQVEQQNGEDENAASAIMVSQRVSETQLRGPLHELVTGKGMSRSATE